MKPWRLGQGGRPKNAQPNSSESRQRRGLRSQWRSREIGKSADSRSFLGFGCRGGACLGIISGKGLAGYMDMGMKLGVRPVADSQGGVRWFVRVQVVVRRALSELQVVQFMAGESSRPQ